MARFRIVKRPCVSDYSKPRYDVQERVWFFWWTTLDFFFSQEEAENLVENIIKAGENK